MATHASMPDLFGFVSTSDDAPVVQKRSAGKRAKHVVGQGNTRVAERIAALMASRDMFHAELVSAEADIVAIEQKLAAAMDAVGMTLEVLTAEQAAWSPEEFEIKWLHEESLLENLDYLMSTDVKDFVAAEKGRILQWVFTQDLIDGVHVSKIPFSFHNCCLVCGVRPDPFRALLLQLPLVRDLLVNLKLYAAKDLPPLRKKVMYSDIAGPGASPNHPVYMHGV